MNKVSTDKVAKNESILSQAIASKGLIFVSGQIHADKDWKLVGNTTEEKFDTCMRNVAAILDEAGSSLDHVVKVTIFVTDMTAIADVNKVYASYFGGILPAREAIGVTALPLGASIEVVVTAESKT